MRLSWPPCNFHLQKGLKKGIVDLPLTGFLLVGWFYSFVLDSLPNRQHGGVFLFLRQKQVYSPAYCFRPCKTMGFAIFIKPLCRFIVKSDFEVI